MRSFNLHKLFYVLLIAPLLAGCSVSFSKDCTKWVNKSVGLSMYVPRDADAHMLPSPERDEWSKFVIENSEGCASDGLLQQALSYLN